MALSLAESQKCGPRHPLHTALTCKPISCPFKCFVESPTHCYDIIASGEAGAIDRLTLSALLDNAAAISCIHCLTDIVRERVALILTVLECHEFTDLELGSLLSTVILCHLTPGIIPTKVVPLHASFPPPEW
jgi:hypothetical protein